MPLVMSVCRVACVLCDNHMRDDQLIEIQREIYGARHTQHTRIARIQMIEIITFAIQMIETVVVGQMCQPHT